MPGRRSRTKPTLGSLFAGIGGFDLGFERAGFEVRWQVEIDDYATRVLEKHWPNVRRYRDVRECGAHNLEPVDCIIGGFPCQPFSVAGRRRGESDERNMWPETIRLVRELRPRVACFENVPGLLSVRDDDGELYFGRILCDLAESGFDAEWFVLSAADVGAPHLRKRLWIAAYPSSQAGRRLFSGRGKQFAQGSEAQGYVAYPNEHRRRTGDGRRSVRDGDGNGAGAQRGRDEQQSGLGDGRATVSDSPCVLGQAQQRDEPDGVLSAVADAACERMEGDGAAGVGVPQSSAGLRISRCNGAGAGATQWSTEPDVGRVADGVPSRVDRLRCLGNAVVPQCAEWIGERIATWLQANDERAPDTKSKSPAT